VVQACNPRKQEIVSRRIIVQGQPQGKQKQQQQKPQDPIPKITKAKKARAWLK
jgi:hypothetical protein